MPMLRFFEALVNLSVVVSLLHFFASPQTPFSVLDVISAAESDGLISQCIATNASTVNELRPVPDSVVLDYTYEPGFAAALKEASSTVISMWPMLAEVSHSASVFARYVQSLNFTRVHIIADSVDAHSRSAHFLIEHYPLTFEEVLVVPANLTLSLALDATGRLLKPSGATIFALIVTSEVAACLLEAFELKWLNKAGYAFILADEGRYVGDKPLALAQHGLLYVAREESWMAATRAHGEAKILIDALMRDWSAPKQLPAYYLVNMRNSQPVLLATSPGDLSLATIVYPGNTTTRPASNKVIIPVSVNNLWLEPDGSVYPRSPIMMRGAVIAFESVHNYSTLLPQFQVVWKSVSLSGMVFNYSFTQVQVQHHAQDLGLFHMPPSLGVNVIQTSKILQDMGIAQPMAIGTRANVLAQPALFPYYLRTRTGNRYCANVLAQIFKFFHWKRLAVLYSADRSDQEELYHDFLDFANFIALNITNDADKRTMMPGLATEAGLAQLNASLTHIMESDVRILLLFSNDFAVIWVQMYDLGIRNEYLIITSTGISYTYLNGNDTNSHKRRVVTKGALQFFPRTFVGAEGAKILQMLKARDGMDYFANGCSYFDCAMLYLHATDYMIAAGINYENATEVMTAMRGTHFVGCAGLITIGKGSNERSDEEYSLINVKYFEGNDSVIVHDAFYYNPFSATLIRVVNPVQWPDNTTGHFVDTLISTYDCPFAKKEVRDFPPGQAVGYSVCFALCALTGGVAIAIWRTAWRKQYPALLTRHEMSADDAIQLVAVPIDALQYAAVGPDPAQLSAQLALLCSITLLELEHYLNIPGVFYWTMLKAMFTIFGIYAVLFLLKVTKLERLLEWLPTWSFLMIFVNLALPVLSSLLFLPVISTLSQIYLCYESTGSDFPSSFLNKDCYTRCWHLRHISYLAGCSVALCLYIPLGVYTRPLWQELQPALHIRSQPLPLMVKSLVQVLLVALDHTLKFHYSEVHAGLFLGVMVLYVAFLICVPQYNYHRYTSCSLNLWHVISLVLVILHAAACIAASLDPEISFICLVAFAGVAAIALAVGVLAQVCVPAFRSYLYRRKMNTHFLIHFAFAFGARATRYLEAHRQVQEVEERQRVPTMTSG